MAGVMNENEVVVIDNVSKSFYTKEREVVALKNISLKIRRGEFLVIVGPSGCGKTTLLRMVAGLEKNYKGKIYVENDPVEGPGLDRGVVFQDHRLLPWLDLEDNVGLGINASKKAVRERVGRYLSKVGLKDFAKAYPQQLSGGMAQRASIARALINQPNVLLLDEPFGALDALTRVKMQEEIERIFLAEKATTILITHDIEEAVFLADRIIVMSSRPGEVSEEYEVRLPRSRNRSDPAFIELRKAVTYSLNEYNLDYVI